MVSERTQDILGFNLETLLGQEWINLTPANREAAEADLLAWKKVFAFEHLLKLAKQDKLVVSKTFKAMHEGLIDREQCKEILTAIERHEWPFWKRWFS